MSVRPSTTVPFWASPSILSLDTALVATLWFAFLGHTFHLSLERADFYAFFLLVVGGSLIFNLTRYSFAGTHQNLLTRRLALLYQEKKLLIILLPMIFLCALVLIYLDLLASIFWQLTVMSLLFAAYLGLLVWSRNIHFWGFPIPLLKGSLLFFLFGAFLWPAIPGSALPLTLGLGFLSLLFCLTFFREESSGVPNETSTFHPHFLPVLNANLPLISLWLLIFLLAALLFSPNVSTAILFVALSTSAINLFILFQWGKKLSFLPFRYLSRLLLALPLIPALF
ncbi:MAG: hypothetical protein JJT75_13380 [Opitutales bacterium]|nr:hypothetical protein [Opitutales bacterium]MCH8539137.1 hypothetical protein [Opitutales bacterium]